MVLTAVKRYSKIYLILFRFGLIQSTTYRVSFITEVLVELGYQLVTFIFFGIIYANVKGIAGWSYHEMIFLIGLNTIASELFTGAFFVFNLRRLPEKIKNGDIDFTLLKPINSLFNLTLGSPYFTSILATLPGFCLMFYASGKLGILFNLINFLSAIIVFLGGLVICYSIVVIFSSLSFKLINAKTLPQVGETIFYNYKAYPHQIYTGLFKMLFFFVLPVIFIASVPASFYLRGIDLGLMLLSILLAIVFLSLTIKIWNHMIRYYSSASS